MAWNHEATHHGINAAQKTSCSERCTATTGFEPTEKPPTSILLGIEDIFRESPLYVIVPILTSRVVGAKFRHPIATLFRG